MARYEIKFSPSDVAYNYEIEAENETEAERIGRDLLVDDMGYDASKAWNCTDIIKTRNKYLYLEEDQESLIIKWNINDIKTHLKDQGREFYPPLTDEDYREILNLVGRHKDASVGVNWEVIDVNVSSYIYRTDRQEIKNAARKEI